MKKVLKIINTNCGADKLLEFINTLDKSEVSSVEEFINDIEKIFKMYCNKDKKITPMRLYLEYARNIGKDKEVGCAIRNCRDIEEYAGSTEVILEFASDNGSSVTISGSGDFGGCNSEEFDELLALIRPMIKNRVKSV